MDATQVMKNVESFIADILPKAYCLKDWNKETIAVAYFGALFCEKVHKNFVDTPESEKLDEMIQTICKKHNQNEGAISGLEDLKSTIDILTRAFFQNPHIDLGLVLSTLKELKKESPFIPKLEDTDTLNSMCEELIESLKPLSSSEVGNSLYHEVKAELLLNYLKNSTSQMTTEDEIEKFLSSAMESMCLHEDNRLICIHMLNMNFPGTYKEIQEFSFNWMMLKISSENKFPLLSTLWKQSCSLLHSLVRKNSTFCNYYVGQLLKLIDTLQHVEEDAWKAETLSSNDIKLEFDDVLSRLKSLLESENEISKSTKGLLLSKINDSIDSSFWDKIYALVI